MKSPQVSIIIVNYHSRDLIANLSGSLSKSQFKNYEVIIIDNDQKNIGYGAAINKGAQKARGEYLFILNPDTLVFPQTLKNLVSFLESHPRVAIVAPTLQHEDGKIFQQGTGELNPISGAVALSFINKLWPNNLVSHKYFYPKTLFTVPGTAFLIRKSIFDQVHGFDQKFFLYFEEFDLCYRVKQLGWGLAIDSTAPLVHIWKASTPDTQEIKNIFASSRFYYFKKHFGLSQALLVEIFCRLSKTTLVYLFVSFLLFYKLNQNISFIGDQAWFYISARDALLNGTLPTLGIASSITWIKQGAVWTYLLIPTLVFGRFNPIWGSVLTSTLGLVTIYVFYRFTRNLHTTLILATSPFFILLSRMAYHTAPIPLFELIFLISVVRKKPMLAAVFMGILYQLHLLTFIFWPLFLFARPKMKHYVIFIISILPFIISGREQTYGAIKWVIKGLITGFPGSNLYSGAYLAVLLVPLLIILSIVMHKIPKKLSAGLTLIAVLYNIYNSRSLNISSFSNISSASQKILSLSQTSEPKILVTGPGLEFSSTAMPYQYLVWYLSRSTKPSGIFNEFIIDTNFPDQVKVSTQLNN